MKFVNDTVRVRFTLTDEMLGMAPSSPKVHEEYIASKAPDALSMEEEVAAIGIEKAIENAMTVFPRDTDGTPIIWDYQFKGFLKDSFKMIRKMPGSKCAGLKAYKAGIDGNIFVVDDTDEHKPQRRIRIQLSGEMGNCQRPLRAETAQGARVALANSETVPAGSWFEVTIGIMDPALKPAVIEACEYAEYHGFGQWRNSGKGCAKVEFLD